MKFIFLFVLFVTQVHAHEREFKTKADKFATAKFTGQKYHPWPFPLLSIGHSMQSYQDYSGSPYWHDGLDIRSEQEQPIHVAAGGKVINIENYVPGNELYWEVAILDAGGYVWKYHHVDESSITQEIRDSYRNGVAVPSGTLIGNVVSWPVVSYGERYHHLHLLVVAWDGKYINPFLMMTPLPDTKSPIINKIGIAQNHRPINGDKVKGPHALYLDASDLVLHDKFILSPHKISYKMDHADEVTVWEFINLPSGKNDTDFIEDFYMDGTCGNYSCRKFYFNLNFTQEVPRKTMTLNPGTHEIEVTVEDIVGNKTSATYSWQVL